MYRLVVLKGYEQLLDGYIVQLFYLGSKAIAGSSIYG